MSGTTDGLLIQKAAELARRAPKEWAEFLDALKTSSEEARDQCVQSPLAELPRTQGRAQSLKALLTLLTDALRSADRIATLRK